MASKMDLGIDSNLVTLSRYVLAEQMKVPHATGEMSQLLQAIQTAVKVISTAVRRAGITQLFGYEGTANTSGEEQKKLDVLANEVFVNLLTASYSVAYMVSEENEDIVEVEASKSGSYIVYFDPLDGSSNIDCLVSIGTIFCIMKKKVPGKPTKADVLRSGLEIAAAGYALYGSATMMVLALNGVVNGFMLDPTIGEFILTDKNMKIPSKGKIYSINEGYTIYLDEDIRRYLEHIKFPSGNHKPQNARYVGSMVSDVHRTIKYGGIFLYPANSTAPKGKLRLLYECFPMAYIVHLAGGMAIGLNGSNILETQPKTIHERSPIVLGSKENVEEFLSFIKKE